MNTKSAFILGIFILLSACVIAAAIAEAPAKAVDRKFDRCHQLANRLPANARLQGAFECIAG